ncbi:MAG: MotA/TolQ/ExbB proton channel family protein [Candidatus Delongbacteria bacterium]|nr:MotA/TolQ/ExbB proton channel family protein [Candidatus Delongbacteria bacterium]
MNRIQTLIMENPVISILVFTVISFIFFFIVRCLYLISKDKTRLYNVDETEILDTFLFFLRKIKSSDEYFVNQSLDEFLEKKILRNHSSINFYLKNLNILGLLGTFLGLSIILPELSQLAKEILRTNSHFAIQNALKNIGDGIGFAFLSSIIGILFAIILSAKYNKFIRQYDEFVKNFKTENLNTIFANVKRYDFDYDPQKLYAEIQDFFLKSMDDFKETVESNYVKLKKWSSDNIKTNVDLVINKTNQLSKKLVDVILNLEEERKDLKKVKNDWLRSLKILSESSENIKSVSYIVDNHTQLTEKLMDKIDDFATGFGQLYTNLNLLNEEIKNPSIILEDLTGAINSFAQNEENTLKAQENVIAELIHTKELIKNNANDISNAIDKNTDIIGNAKKDISTGINQELNNFIKKYKEYKEEDSEKSKEFYEKIKNEILTNSDQNYDDIKKLAESGINKINDQINIINELFKTTTDFLKNSSNLFNADVIHNDIEDVSEKIQNQLLKIQDIDKLLKALDRNIGRAFEFILNRL